MAIPKWIAKMMPSWILYRFMGYKMAYQWDFLPSFYIWHIPKWIAKTDGNFHASQICHQRFLCKNVNGVNEW